MRKNGEKREKFEERGNRKKDEEKKGVRRRFEGL